MTEHTRSREIESWFAEQRGIGPATLDAWGVTTDEHENVLMPCSFGVRVRRSPLLPKEEGPRFHWRPGGNTELLGPRQPGRRQYVLCEGESDAMRLFQAMAEAGRLEGIGVYALPGVHNWRDDTMLPALESAETVYVVLDNPHSGEYEKDKSAAETVERGWRKVKAGLGSRAKRVTLPPEVKDVCEFFARYDLAAFDVLLERAAAEAPWPPRDRPRRVKAITTRELAELRPEPMDWVVEPILAAGAITMLAGLMKAAGKSTFGKDLAAAIAYGEDFLGWPTQQGSVVYVTEEAPEVFKHSLEESHPRLLETDRVIPIFQTDLFSLAWEEIVEEAVLEAQERGAKLIVFDTLMDLASVTEENSSAEAQRVMSVLKRAQATGVGILLLVHSPKAQDLKIEQMFRGHGSWFGAVDQGLALRPSGSGEDRRVFEALGRLSRGRQSWELSWASQAGWSLVEDGKESYRHLALEAMIETLSPAPAQQLTEKELRRVLASKRLVSATIEDALHHAARQGWIRRWEAAAGETNPATGQGYRGGNRPTLVRLTEEAPTVDQLAPF